MSTQTKDAFAQCKENASKTNAPGLYFKKLLERKAK